MNLTTLTGVKDVDYKILNQYSDQELVSYCELNRAAHTFCEDDDYWKSRTRHVFDYIPYNILVKNKDNKSWNQYYIDLAKLKRAPFEISDVSVKNRINPTLDKVMVLFHDNITPEKRRDILRYLLILTSILGYLDTVEYLLNLNQELNLKIDLMNPLNYASKNGHVDVVKALLNAGADIHGGHMPDQALYLAVTNGRFNVADYLLSKGANPETLRILNLNRAKNEAIKKYILKLIH